MNSRFTWQELKQKSLVEDRLKAIAAQLIAAHHRKTHDVVVPYARQAGLPVEGESPHRLFMRTIQVFHPDRLSVLWDRIEKAHAASNPAELDALVRLLEHHPDRAPRRIAVDFEDEEEEYGFGTEDFGYDIQDEDEESEWDGETVADEGTFYSAVKSELFGNLDVYPDASDLSKLEGELDLSDYGLFDLEGIEYCQGLTSINLSQNNIDNVYPLGTLTKLESLDLAENDLEDADALGGLTQLKELDLSANDIDDVAFLERLTSLRYVDLTGNPVRNKAVLERLESRGVIVIT